MRILYFTVVICMFAIIAGVQFILEYLKLGAVYYLFFGFLFGYLIGVGAGILSERDKNK